MDTPIPAQRKTPQLLVSGLILLVALVTLSFWFAGRQGALSASARAGLDVVLAAP